MKLFLKRYLHIHHFIIALGILLPCLSFTSDTRTPQLSYLKYDVEIQNKVVGSMITTKNVSPTNPSEIDYLINSAVHIDFISNIDVEYSLHSTFKEDLLHFSKLVNKVNKDTQRYTQTRWDGVGYKTWDGKKNDYINGRKITYSVGCLYFKEPVGITHLFSENYLAFCPITKVDDYYLIEFPDGNKNYYKYQNGTCVWVEAHQRLYKILFKLKEFK